jgi:hypothetical protein
MWKIPVSSLDAATAIVVVMIVLVLVALALLSRALWQNGRDQ